MLTGADWQFKLYRTVFTAHACSQNSDCPPKQDQTAMQIYAKDITIKRGYFSLALKHALLGSGLGIFPCGFISSGRCLFPDRRLWLANLSSH